MGAECTNNVVIALKTQKNETINERLHQLTIFAFGGDTMYLLRINCPKTCKNEKEIKKRLHQLTLFGLGALCTNNAVIALITQKTK